MTHRKEYVFFSCVHCEEEWIIVDPGRDLWDYFCPFCSEKQIHKESFDDEKEDEDESRTTIVQKTSVRRFAEDRMTEKMCLSGWWNPITKKCMGEGVGFEAVDKYEET